jgi:hypothetical protein
MNEVSTAELADGLDARLVNECDAFSDTNSEMPELAFSDTDPADLVRLPETDMITINAPAEIFEIFQRSLSRDMDADEESDTSGTDSAPDLVSSDYDTDLDETKDTGAAVKRERKRDPRKGNSFLVC